MNKRILRLAIPNIISNLSVPILGAVDTALMGHLDQLYYLGALAVGGIIFDFIYWGFGFLRMGTTGLTAQAYGNKDEKEVTLILMRTLLMAAICGTLVILLQSFIAGVSFLLIDATPEVERYAKVYFHIRIYAAPATLALYAFHGWFLGMQNAKYPLILAVVVNVINLILNFIFILKFHMAADGVATGTLIAQYVGLILAIYLCLRKYPDTFRRLPGGIFDTASLRRTFSVNADIFVRTLGLVFTFTYFTAQSAKSGDLVLAVNTILLQLLLIMAYGVDGIAFATESLVGRYIGAKDVANLKRAISYSFRWGIAMAAVFALVYALSGESIVRIFTDKEQVITLAMSYAFWIAIAPIINSTCFIWDGVFIGATATAPMRNSMLFCAFLVFLPACYLLKPSLGNHGLWLAMTLFMVMRGVTLTAYARTRIYGHPSLDPGR